VKPILKFGCMIPTCTAGIAYDEPSLTTHGAIIRIAKAAEDLGFDSIWGNEHIVTPNYLVDVPSHARSFYESLTTLSYLAAITNRVGLGTCVVPLALRNPVVIAKQVVTLDVLSGGRMILGVGLGAYKEEFQIAKSFVPLNERTRMYDENLRALRALLDEPKASFSGKHVKFSEVEIHPKPIQKPFPIYVGGNSEMAIRRAAEYGQGWIPASPTPEEVRNAVEKLRKLTKDSGRDYSQIEVCPQTTGCLQQSREEAFRKFRGSMSYRHFISLRNSTFRHDPNYMRSVEERRPIGNPDDIIKKIEKLGDAGMTHFIMAFIAENLDDLLNSMKLFAQKVMPSFRHK